MSSRTVGLCRLGESHSEILHERSDNCVDWKPHEGRVICDHCPDHTHSLDDDGTLCKRPRIAPEAAS